MRDKMHVFKVNTVEECEYGIKALQDRIAELKKPKVGELCLLSDLPVGSIVTTFSAGGTQYKIMRGPGGEPMLTNGLCAYWPSRDNYFLISLPESNKE